MFEANFRFICVNKYNHPLRSLDLLFDCGLMGKCINSLNDLKSFS